MNESFGGTRLTASEEGQRSEKITAGEKLALALDEVRETLLDRLGFTDMEEARQHPIKVLAELERMTQEFNSVEDGSMYYQAEAASQVRSIFERALAYEGELQKYPQAAAILH